MSKNKLPKTSSTTTDLELFSPEMSQKVFFEEKDATLVCKEIPADETAPYYSRFFTQIVSEVSSRTCFSHLWTDQELIENCFRLPEGARQTFVRLFLRKHQWISVAKIEPHMQESLKLLVSNGFLLSDSELTDLSTILNLLPLEGVRKLAKIFKIPDHLLSGKSRLCTRLAEFSAKQKSVFGQSLEENVICNYLKCCDWEAEIARALQKGNYDSVVALGFRAKHFNDQLPPEEIAQYQELPQFVRRYTAPWVATRTVWESVEALQKQKDYEKAVDQLRWLLDSNHGDLWCPDYRGRWWNRLALNCDAHLKSAQSAHLAVEAICCGLEDGTVRAHDRYSLLERAERLRKSQHRKKSGKAGHDNSIVAKLDSLVAKDQEHWRTVKIRGELLKKNLGDGCKTVFLQQGKGNFKVCNVEAIALHHYVTKENFSQGVHGESGPWLAVFGLLFWNEIYRKNIGDVWVSSLQSDPLDLTDPQFLLRRKLGFDSRLSWLAAATPDDISKEISEVWTENSEKTVGLVAWDKFDGVEQIQQFASCVGGAKLAEILKYLAEDYRHRRSGFPDLTVWNVTESRLKVVEVKGPGDRLSSKQRIWLNFFISQGIDAELCLVEGAETMMQL